SGRCDCGINAKTGASQKLFQAHEGPVQTLVWQDNKTLVSLGGNLGPGNQGGTVHFWQLDGDKPTRTIKGMPAAGKFSPGGKLLTPVAAGDWESPFRQIWDMNTGLLCGTLAHFPGQPTPSRRHQRRRPLPPYGRRLASHRLCPAGC